ncbi:MAG: hypothetical protein MJ072_05235, partial [Clostridia bacterium]|nr:hypothetical protein [Clostridia bacterium]
GNVDGVIITARHGANHFKYAKPYIGTGAPMFIDKPITTDEDEAVSFMRALKNGGIKITGGSSCVHADFVKELKADVENGKDGKTLGGFLKTPFDNNEKYGGYWFYMQHLVEIESEIFGRNVKSVRAIKDGNGNVNATFVRDDFTTNGLFTEHVYSYYAARVCEKEVKGGKIDVDNRCFEREFDEFYSLLNGGDQKISYEDFIKPVFTISAILRSLVSGKDEQVKEIKI